MATELHQPLLQTGLIRPPPANRAALTRTPCAAGPSARRAKAPSCACHPKAEPFAPSAVTPTKIVVTRRFADYHAAIDGTNGCKWGCGKTIDEAVGNLVRNHPGAFGAIVDLEKAGVL